MLHDCDRADRAKQQGPGRKILLKRRHGLCVFRRGHAKHRRHQPSPNPLVVALAFSQKRQRQLGPGYPRVPSPRAASDGSPCLLRARVQQRIDRLQRHPRGPVTSGQHRGRPSSQPSAFLGLDGPTFFSHQCRVSPLPPPAVSDSRRSDAGPARRHRLGCTKRAPARKPIGQAYLDVGERATNANALDLHKPRFPNG